MVNRISLVLETDTRGALWLMPRSRQAMQAGARDRLISELEARCRDVEEELIELTAKLRRIHAARSAEEEPKGSSLLDFVAARARAEAQTPEEASRLEQLISATHETSLQAQAAQARARKQHEDLIAEFGQEAVDAWKQEHADVAQELVRQQDSEVAPLQAAFEQVIANEQLNERTPLLPPSRNDSGRRVPPSMQMLDAPVEAAAASAGAGAGTFAAMRSGRAQLLRHILHGYYSEHAPDGLHKVEDLVARVVGGPPTVAGDGSVVGGCLWTEHELFARLEEKYGAKVAFDDF
jgi:hypothetical protein